MNVKQLRNLGLPTSQLARLAAQRCAQAAHAGLNKGEMKRRIAAVLHAPEDHTTDELFGPLARALIEYAQEPPEPTFTERDDPAPAEQWGSDLDANAVQQMHHARRLPVAVRAALMPDAHLGYGLPIGGVLACDNVVIPYAVGVDIACRMKLSVLDLPTDLLRGQQERLTHAIEAECRFGVGAEFKPREAREHPVLDEDWSITDVTQKQVEKAKRQLGTSGSGNHFVEFGILTLDQPDLGLEPGEYLALLSHSGSRGPGAATCDFYSRLAVEKHPELPPELRALAWLSLDEPDGQAYWAAMQLMGRFAAANHAMVHHHVARHLKAGVLAEVENHHNFAWREQHDGREVIVHRKGATPAGAGVLGVIPGSMASPGYVVRGKGHPDALGSASHGAGRVMSRKQARERFTWSAVKAHLAAAGVTLISAGLDEVPMVYKDIETVMSHQRDLVDIVARFEPKLVKMAPGGRAED